MLHGWPFPDSAFAQADEIQVYDGGLAPVGTFNLTVHNNFTPAGKIPALCRRGRARQLPERRAGVGSWRHGLVRGRSLHAALQP